MFLEISILEDDFNSWLNSLTFHLTGDDCPEDWVQFRASCYKSFHPASGITWLEARTLCEEQDSYLTSVMNKAEMTVLHYLLTTTWAAKDTSTYIGKSETHEFH